MQTWETITVERPVPLQEATMTDNTTNQKTSDTDMAIDARHTDISDVKEIVASEQCKVFCMYSMGNFISGQRWHTRYDDPAFYREYTGDAVLLQLTCTRNKAGRADFSVLPLLITQYNESAYPVVKRFTQEWLDTLSEKEKNYFTKRLELMEAYLPVNLTTE